MRVDVEANLRRLRQRWRIVWDRTSDNWTGETITWFLNDQQFHQVRGDQIGDLGVWQSLAQKPLFFILNVAVGGDWVWNLITGQDFADPRSRDIQTQIRSMGMGP